MPIWHPSPNFGPRRDGLKPSMVVIHFTGMASCDAALERLCDPQAQVSSHYLIAEDGTLMALVAEDQRAWHAGAGAWRGLADVNSRSIGIELANTGHHPFPEGQMQRLTGLLAQIIDRWDVPLRDVIGHSDMAPDRKEDPGPRFDWARLARMGLAFAPPVAVAAESNPPPLARSLTTIGYPDAPDERRLLAFRHRYCPQASGPEVPWDRALAAQIAAACVAP